MAAIDKLIDPIANTPGDFDKLDEFLDAPPPRPLDETNCREECESLVTEIVLAYPDLGKKLQSDVRQMFLDHESFTWASSMKKVEPPEENLRRVLIHFIIRDQNHDPRDSIMEIDAIINHARQGDLDVKRIVKPLLRHANNESKWGFPSTRELLQSKI